MIRLIKIVVAVSMLLAVSLPTMAIEYETSMSQTPTSTNREEEGEKPGNRMPPRNVVCVISEDGVSLPLADGEEITLFEVYDANGAMLTSCVSEEDFLEFIFASQVSGVVEIRIHTAWRYFRGYINLV